MSDDNDKYVQAAARLIRKLSYEGTEQELIDVAAQAMRGMVEQETAEWAKIAYTKNDPFWVAATEIKVDRDRLQATIDRLNDDCLRAEQERDKLQDALAESKQAWLKTGEELVHWQNRAGEQDRALNAAQAEVEGLKAALQFILDNGTHSPYDEASTKVRKALGLKP